MAKLQHKGIREFTAEELSGVSLGQSGFKVIANGSEVECGVTSGYENIKYFVALKAIDADTELEARTYIPDTDDLTTNSGTYNGSSPVTVLNGDIIYGAFDKVECTSAGYVIAYIGR
jgi:hypothetical protein